MELELQLIVEKSILCTVNWKSWKNVFESHSIFPVPRPKLQKGTTYQIEDYYWLFPIINQ